MNEKLKDLLDHVRTRPEMYFGVRSITGFWNMYSGERTAAWFYGESDSNLVPREGFFGWLKNKYPDSLGLDWKTVLLELCDKDESKAFDRFWFEWDEFERPVKPKDEIVRKSSRTEIPYDFEALIEDVRERPQRYYDPLTIMSLENFIVGFHIYAEMSGLSRPFWKENYHEFHEWMAMECFKKSNCLPVSLFLLDKCKGDDAKAIKLFWKKWQKYRKSE